MIYNLKTQLMIGITTIINLNSCKITISPDQDLALATNLHQQLLRNVVSLIWALRIQQLLKCFLEWSHKNLLLARPLRSNTIKKVIKWQVLALIFLSKEVKGVVTIRIHRNHLNQMLIMMMKNMEELQCVVLKRKNVIITELIMKIK